jgi:hypothetical protein
MELPHSSILLDLVAGQARIEQSVIDIKDRFDKTIPYMANEHKELNTRVTGVEKKLWYFSGAGTAVGALVGTFATWFRLR